MKRWAHKWGFQLHQLDMEASALWHAWPATATRSPYWEVEEMTWSRVDERVAVTEPLLKRRLGQEMRHR